MMDRAASIKAMVEHDRSIIRPEFAAEVLEPWGVTLDDLDLAPVVREEGANWDTREEVWEAGPSIGMYQVACRLADYVNAPDVEYETDYMGTGKRAAALCMKACTRLDLMVES